LEYFEIEQIWNKQITIQRLVEVRDAFIFQCFTGFAFQDIFALTIENIVKVGITGERWLIKDRGKTGVSETVSILPISKMLGQKTVRTTQRYAKVRKNKISKTLARVKGIIFDKNGQLMKIAI